ncbi:MAG TPA: hypothetical protein VEL76_02155 [Gemmataceae bacterium]|nr:hypothetical protein [Gemmataceae bacterium]
MGYYLDTLRWRWLSAKQRAKRVEINWAVLARATGEGRRRA